MILLEEYYELQEVDYVSKFWKVSQIISYLSAAAFGLWCGFTLATLRPSFNNKCFLFAKIIRDPEPGSGEIHFAESEYVYEDPLWSQDNICDYCQYSMVSSFIFSTIWAAFFLMCGRGGKSATGLPQPWRIALPAMIFSFIYFIIAFVAALQIQEGIRVLCEKSLYIKDDHKFGECAVLKVYEKIMANKILNRMEIAIKTSWITAVSWFFAFLIPLLRIVFVIDFTLYKVSVFKLDDLHKRNEEIVRVVEYDDGKHVHFSNDEREHPHDD